jgi:hypothetical protein
LKPETKHIGLLDSINKYHYTMDGEVYFSDLKEATPELNLGKLDNFELSPDCKSIMTLKQGVKRFFGIENGSLKRKMFNPTDKNDNFFFLDDRLFAMETKDG